MSEEQIKGKPGRLGGVSIVLAVSLALTLVVTLLLLVFAVLFYQSERAHRVGQRRPAGGGGRTAAVEPR